MIQRNDRCWCGSTKKWKQCHYPHLPSNAEGLRTYYLQTYGIILKSQEQIEGVRRASQLAAQILEALCQKAQAGVSTDELDALAQHLHREAGAIAASLGYGFPPFPKSICTSLNEVICHGIPSSTVLKEGDIVNIDVATILHGFFGDCNKMVAIGQIDEEKRRVVDVSYECLHRSIAILKPGLALCAIGQEIEQYAQAHGCSVVNQFVGHGVGIAYHEPPHIPHHYNRIRTPLAEGMIFTIEPMINAGVRTAVIDPRDRWTARTADGKPSAQWEHTLLITQDGYEVLTQR